MLKIKKSKKEEIQEEKEIACDSAIVQVEQSLPDENLEEQTDKKSKGKERKENKTQEEQTILSDLESFAILLNTTVENLKNEFYSTQIKKIMTRLQKTVVRYDMSEAEMDRIFLSVNQYGLGGMTVAPAYLPNSVRQIKKNKAKIDLCAIIDFPFGESSFKGKISNVKESLKMGANTVAVAMSSMMFNSENLKELRKQCKKLCRISKNGAGIVINASDINEANYSEAIKRINKTKISFITLAFGDATLEEVKSKLQSLQKCGINKNLFVLANIDRVESAVEVFKENVDCVLTPYADDIGNDLLKRYRLV